MGSPGDEGVPRGRGSGLRLLPREALIATSEVDHADWNYRPLLGALQRKRFALALSLMGSESYERLLEVGYGSGVFMPELAGRCGALYGVDLHGRERQVAERLADHGVRAELASAGLPELPYEDSLFDCAVAVSSLEYVRPIAAGVDELARVLAPEATLIVVTPGHSRLLDVALRIATGEDARDNYGDRRQRLIPALLRRFRLAGERRFPAGTGGLAVYRALRLERA